MEKVIEPSCLKVIKEEYMDYYFYQMPNGNTHTTKIHKGASKNDKPIIRYSRFPINGYIRTHLKDGRYSFLEGKKDKKIEENFDIAFDVNEYGWAMIGRNGKVGWFKPELIKENIILSFDEVFKFERIGNNILSRLVSYTKNGVKTYYMNITGEIINDEHIRLFEDLNTISEYSIDSLFSRK